MAATPITVPLFSHSWYSRGYRQTCSNVIRVSPLLSAITKTVPTGTVIKT